MRAMLVNMGVPFYFIMRVQYIMCVGYVYNRFLAGDGRSTAIVPPKAARAMPFGKLAGDGRSAAIVPPEAARAM